MCAEGGPGDRPWRIMPQNLSIMLCRNSRHGVLFCLKQVLLCSHYATSSRRSFLDDNADQCGCFVIYMSLAASYPRSCSVAHKCTCVHTRVPGGNVASCVFSRSAPLLGALSTDTLGLSIFLSWLCIMRQRVIRIYPE